MVFKMKLRNKKTGEIKECVVIPIDSNGYPNEYQVFEKDESLAELNAEWEDYEEPKDFWYIDVECGVMCDSTDPDLQDKRYPMEFMKSIGNYFSSREEAEKAVEKLKAITRLRSCAFKFKGWRTADLGADKYYFVITAESDGAGKGDLDLLFGGEE
jgi:hypothetical protein